MTLDNSKTIISLRIKLFGATVVFLAYILLAYVAKLIKYPLLGMSDTAWTLILVGIFLLIAFLPMFLNYQFIFFSDEGENIVIRYFTTGVVGGKKNSVEINKKTFSGYKIESSLFGLKQSITLFQQLKEGVAKYPPIYISALNREERAKVLRSLNLYAPRV
jgi:nitrogen fixation/metabolism regulation signal transduction histidine kinase